MTFADDAELSRSGARRDYSRPPLSAAFLDTMADCCISSCPPRHIKRLGHHMVTHRKGHARVLEADFFGASVAGHSEIAARSPSDWCFDLHFDSL